eukprot:EC691650.1.p3 GENE.EC691650.1~~EC691650.1.p3  ORF type:complete len:88 (-),score=12.50 EC691650.1:351-614(-)
MGVHQEGSASGSHSLSHHTHITHRSNNPTNHKNNRTPATPPHFSSCTPRLGLFIINVHEAQCCQQAGHAGPLQEQAEGDEIHGRSPR